MKRFISRKHLAASMTACAFIMGATSSAFAAEYPQPSKHKKVVYSPYPEEMFPNRVFFGDTHLHTSYSTDAGMIGNTLGPDMAYRFAKGEAVTASMGQRAKLRRPLDFIVVADHAESLGAAPAIAASDPIILESEFGRTLHKFVKNGEPDKAYDTWLAAGRDGNNPLAGELRLIKPAWEHITTVADRHNEPGRFTAFIGFEWSSHPGGDNLHRVVVFRDGKEKANQVIPISRDDTVDPEDLWKWMGNYEKKTGGQILAIPHNGNLSNGLMFDDVTLTARKPLDKEYAQTRSRWEPLVEVTQMKGDGETHPLLSPDDEFADFETWDKASFGPNPKTQDMLPREYAREALKRGLAYEKKLSVNPFKFGMIGSTDSHTSLSTTDEDSFFGKVPVLEPSNHPDRFNEVIAGRPAPKSAQIYARETSASGLVAVWSRENTRENLWDSMKRKEVYATTGTRLRVRVFAGYDLEASDLERSDFAKYAYSKGVPMGGDLAAAPEGKAPVLIVRALRDPDGANLDRIQVIKGWLDKEGKTHEKVYDVAMSDDRKAGADGKVPLVGNTVNVKEAIYTNAIGAPFLTAYWKDPDFDPGESAFYYTRVLEIPTPRWTTYDARIFGVDLPKDVPSSIQERAYTSPIWYSPKG